MIKVGQTTLHFHGIEIKNNFISYEVLFIVNDQVVQVSTVLNHNDLICHQVHRHEPPVTAQPISILHEDDQLVVVNKPSSIPVSLME